MLIIYITLYFIIKQFHVTFCSEIHILKFLKCLMCVYSVIYDFFTVMLFCYFICTVLILLFVGKIACYANVCTVKILTTDVK